MLICISTKYNIKIVRPVISGVESEGPFLHWALAQRKAKKAIRNSCYYPVITFGISILFCLMALGVFFLLREYPV